jgi:hypothetical protein
MPSETNTKPRGWKHFFARRNKAAMDGRHLPATKDLMLGMSFFANDLERDAQTWAERLLMRLDEAKEGPLCAPVVQALKRLTVSPDMADFAHAGKVLLEREVPSEFWLPRDEARKRCMVYGAALGDHSAIAALCAEHAHNLRKWTDDADETRYRIYVLFGAAAHLDRAEDRAGFHFRNMGHFRLEGEIVGTRLDCLKEPCASPSVVRRKRDEDCDSDSDSETDEEVVAAKPASGKDEHDGPGRIVFRSIGNEKIAENGKIKDYLKDVLGKRLPLRPLPPTAAIRSTLRGEFPHACDLIDTILEELAGHDHVAMRPTVLAGLPGCGKTTFAMRFAELACLPWEIYSCAGVHDAMFAGNARGWSSGEPAFPTSLLASSAIANPVVILDEIEKAGGNSRNGNFLEALLPMLEPRSAAKFFDVFIEASVDLSGVVFLGTANDPDRMPRPLRDRCRILAFPSPEREHLLALVPGLLKSIIATKGMDPRWVPAFTADELEAMAGAWQGGSLRALQRMIEAVLRARDHEVEYH